MFCELMELEYDKMVTEGVSLTMAWQGYGT